MGFQRSRVLLGVLLLLSTLPVSAQTTAGQEDTVSSSEVRRLRAETEKDRALADDLRTQILDLYDSAISSLEKAADNRAAALNFERERSGIDRMIADLRAELEKPERQPRLPLPEDPSVAQAEDALARERARLSANRLTLRNQQRVAEDRAQSRNDISQRLGELDLELELLTDELRQQAEYAARAELKVAARLNVLARREVALSEIAMLRARLVLLSDLSALIPLETDLVQRRVSFSQELVNMLEEATHELRVEQAREELGRIREQSRQLSEELPMLAPIATETEELADTLWATDGVVADSERTVKAIDTTRHHQAQLNRIAELTSRKFEAYGHRGSVTRWWPDIPEDFPEPGYVTDIIQHLEEEIPEVEHQLIVYEQQRSRALDLARKTMLDLQTELGEELDPELVQRVRDLLAVRQDLLDELIQRGGRYSNQLVEFRTTSSRFLEQLQDVERFLFSHVLWSRSVPKPIIPRLRDMGAAMGWLTSTKHLQSVSVIGIEIRGRGIFALLLLALIVLLRQPMRTRLREIAERISDPERDSLKFTVEALALTVLLAAPLPMVLYFAGTLIDRIGGSTYWNSSATAFFELVVVATLLESVRQVFAPNGLAEAHFAWPTHATRPLHRGLLWTEGIGLPLLYVALHLAFAGIRLNSPDQLQLYNNSLGRVAFIAALFLIGLSLLAILRPAKKDEPSDQEMRVPWPRRFSKYAFPTAFLGAYPIIIVATIVPAVLAALGFYVTGMLLAYQMLRTLLLALAVMVGGGLVHRWRIVNRNRSLLESSDEVDEEQRQIELETAEKQVRQLFRFGVIAVLAIGLFTIWSDALPMLQLLKRVQILPHVQMLEAAEDTAVTLGATADISETPEEPAAESEGTGMPGVPPMPGGESARAAQPAAATPLTLWNLFEAILAGVFTLVLVKNLPGVIEFMLKRRTTLDIGARIAFTTLVRYLITIIGTVVVFGLLGVTWDKVQWLAAALTFGLAFGLQEIVANFVSGLILLVERPVRVGDVVTIGNLTGRVTRIQIRATTITLWDRSEMIVPNKEFITTKLVNWTLSDSKRRIEIPLRIAYGADLDLVKKLLVDAADQHPSVLDDPAPHVLLLTFGDDAINFELRFVVDFGQGLATKDAVQMAIEGAFREQGIEFALPKSEVRFISESSGAPDPVDPAPG
jgi:potassium efflux system protein